MIHPRASAPTRHFSSRRHLLHRQPPGVLRRQQPGWNLRRHGVRCVRGPEADCVLGRVGDGLLDLLLPRSATMSPRASRSTTFDPNNPTGSGRYSTLFRQRVSRPVTADPHLRHDPDALGPLDPTAHASHMIRRTFRTPPATTSFSRSATATTRWPTSPPRTRPAPSGRAACIRPLVTARYGPYHDVFWGIAPVTGFPTAGRRSSSSTPGGRRGASGRSPRHRSAAAGRHAEPLRWRIPRGAARAPWGQVQKSAFLSVGGVVTKPAAGRRALLRLGLGRHHRPVARRVQRRRGDPEQHQDGNDDQGQCLVNPSIVPAMTASAC